MNYSKLPKPLGKANKPLKTIENSSARFQKKRKPGNQKLLKCLHIYIRTCFLHSKTVLQTQSVCPQFTLPPWSSSRARSSIYLHTWNIRKGDDSAVTSTSGWYRKFECHQYESTPRIDSIRHRCKVFQVPEIYVSVIENLVMQPQPQPWRIYSYPNSKDPCLVLYL